MAEISKVDRRKVDELFKIYDLVSEGADVYVTDMRYDFSRWSKTAVEYYGLPDEYMIGVGELCASHIHPADREEYIKDIEELFAGKKDVHDIQYRAKNSKGEYDVCTCRGTIMKDEEGNARYFVGVIRNQSIGSFIDKLTGLKNQRAFFRDVQLRIDEEKEFNVMLLGTSHFSKFNDMYGYDFGNMLLQHAARWIEQQTKDFGTLYRLDGIKLAIIATDKTMDDVQKLYEKFRDVLRATFRLDGKIIDLPINGGAVNVDVFDVDCDIVFSCLNSAYEDSKYESGGDLKIFEKGLSTNKREKLHLLNKVRNSVTMGCRGFMLYYQPIVDAQTEMIKGAEALIRWRDVDGTVVPPNEFIPILENDSQFPVLGEWILREAMRQAKDYLGCYPDFVLSVNLSYAQIQKADFVDVVLKLLEDMEYPAKNLCLEITERCRLIDMRRLRSVTEKLRAKGVKIAVDDFGTGFSSLNLLQELECDTVKVDRSFVKNIESDNREERLVSVITDLADIFGASTCVEGIETEAMRDIIRRYPVASFQGYLYSKPLPFFDFMKKYAK